jgi:adenine-specific DNA glycosylase
MKLLPQDRWARFSNQLIWHGRRVCMARNPDHEHCILAPVCPTYALVQLGKSPLTKPKKNGKQARKANRVTKKPLAKKPAKKRTSKTRTR